MAEPATHPPVPAPGAVPDPGAAGRPYPGAVLDLLAAGGERIVVEHGDRVVTAAELLRLIGRISTGLRDAGLGPGDGVAMVLGVSPEAFAAMIAAQVVGARVIGVRPGLTPDQLRHVLGWDVAAVVMDDSTATGHLREAAGDAMPLAVGRVPGLPDLTAAGGGEAAPEPAGHPDGIARIILTSGSTGDPKGCAQTYAALTAGWAAVPGRWPAAIRDLATGLARYLVFGSLSSLVMMEYGVLALAAGGTLVVADTSGPGPLFPEAFVRHRATASVFTVPRLHQLVRAQQERPVPLPTLRALIVSGSPLDPGRLGEALRVLGPVVYHGYGQTETGMISMATPAELRAALVPAPAAASPTAAPGLGSVGRPPPAVTVQIRDPAGVPVPPGTVGELYVRTPSQASGYWADPVETGEVFVDGWVRTRDLGRLDPDGWLYLEGRIRDVVIVNANLHYVGPIERALADHPDVAEAYVVAMPDEQTGEAPHAFVVPVGGGTPDPDRLRALVAERCGPACVPRSVTLLDEVPVTPGGKPDKRALARTHHRP